MLGHRGIAELQKPGEITNRSLAVNQLANDQQSMAVGERLQQVAGTVGRSGHHFTV